MLLAIPSRGRHDRLKLEPWRGIARSETFALFVPKPEAEAYRRRLELDARVISVPEEWRIARKRRAMAQWAAAQGHERIFMVDDDLGFLVRRSGTSWQLENAGHETLLRMMQMLGEQLDRPEVSHVAVSCREGNIHFGRAGAPSELVSPNTRAIRAVAWKIREYLAVESRIDGREDLDTTLQSLRAGYENRVLGFWAQGQRGTQDRGGCAAWRTEEMVAQTAEALAAAHPGLVRLVPKKNKTGGLRERMEVVIAWKAAAREGAAHRAGGPAEERPREPDKQIELW